MTDRLPEHELDALFSETRARPAEPGADLMARVLADADAALRPAPRPTGAAAGDRWLFDLIGGWLGLGGLAAATLAGLWIGVMPVTAIDALAAELLGGPVSVEASVDDLFLAVEG